MKKYKIYKTNGKSVDPDALYFILRLDDECKDKIHLEACKKTALTYVEEIKDHMPKLAKQMIEIYNLK